MNQAQQKIVSERIQRDQMFVQVFSQEIAMKRKIRMDSIDVVLRAAQLKKEEIPHEEMIKRAKEVFAFVTADGGLESLEPANIKLVQ